MTAPGLNQCAYCIAVKQGNCKVAEDRVAAEQEEQDERDQGLRTLEGYFDTRTGHQLARGRAYLANPNRVVFRSTEEAACAQCSQRGFSCVTVPGRVNCAFCASMGGGRSYYCSTADERTGNAGRDGENWVMG